ncbi:protein DltB [Lapidilactobacillus concavus DSM 17758]|uniref:Teichoic acid D-alanyltransferase n=1 Tax=Lapidilactobacillus concavus DSM 17758 TaxID=1423735 RepID=A0A0R1WED8_9LACO|nr:D-alanyl-lipoteichoic acid biosynthesis protein DltB [Lapidilactobacillus concavus]KRM12460.1 protein DltB [Lapidilactobacillus concavus DSM 17758]GEL13295.1 D-alanyl-lipoteichoic acid biosynthesis protein DltB [Lapidilactobacillus concavus]
MINLQPYSNPNYFMILLAALLPIMIGLYFGRRLKIYEALFTFSFLVLTFGGDHWHQGVALIIYTIYQVGLTMGFERYRRTKNQTSIFVSTVLLSILPLVIVKFTPLFPNDHSFNIGFLGISYLTFKTVQVIMELRDGTIKEISWQQYLQFLLFFPTISSGPIDRYRRFIKDYDHVPDRKTYLADVDQAVFYLFQGFLYKYILGYIFGTLLLPNVSQAALSQRYALGGTGISWYLLAYMYVYSMYLFFDFAGYSLFAVSISYFMGIKTPMNFNKPFLAHNIKEFWNRWHMTLSFWFRDFIFMRFTFWVMKHHWVKNRVRMSQLAYLVNFLVMGFWHGITWYYIVYGLFHAAAIILNDYWLRYKKKHADQIPHNKWTEGLAIFATFNIVCFSFLIFSGFLNQLWF